MAGMIKKIRVKASASDEGRVISVGQIPQEEASCIYFKDENVPGDKEGNFEIKSPAGKKLNLLADGESIQIKPGFKEDGKINTLQLDVEAGGVDSDEFPIKVCNGLKEKAVRVVGTKLNTAEVVLDTQNADTTKFDKTVMDIKFRNDTWNDGIETDGTGPIYAKLKARAIDLRCYDHGGIALQPAGADGDGFTNKIKFEHSLLVSPDHFGEYSVTVGTTQIGTETLYNFSDDEWFLLGEITGYEVGVLEQAVQVFGEKVLDKKRSKWNDGMKMLSEGHFGITYGGDAWEIGVGTDPENISISGANGDAVTDIIGKNLYIKRLASEGLKENTKPEIKLVREEDDPVSGDYLKFIVPTEGEGSIQVSSALGNSSTSESPIYAVAVEKDGKHWESDENGYIVIDNIQYKISSDKVSFDGEENRIFPISDGKFTIEPLKSIHFAVAGGDGIEWGTFNPFHTSIFSSDYRFNASGLVYAATRGEVEAVEGKCDFPTQADDFKDILDESKSASWEEIINVARKYADGELSGGADLTGYATEEFVSNAISQAQLESPEVDLTGYIKEENLESKGYATETFVTNAISQAQLEGEGIDLSGYATKEELSSLSETCAKIDDLYDYAKVSDVQNTYVSKDELESEGFIKEIPSEYVTDSELTAKGYITSIPAGYVTVDSLESKGYITEADLNAKGYLTSFEVPSEYITESELTAKGYLTSFEIPAEYVTESELTAKEYITVNDIPESYVTKKYLEDNNYLKSIPVSLSNQINSLISDVADIKNTNTNQDTAISTLQAASLTGMRYIGSTSSVPTSASEGNVWKSTGSFTIDGKSVEPGDFIICTDSTPHFDVWQANVTKDAYFDTNTITSGQVLITDGTSGKIKCSGFTVAKSVPADAVFTDTTYSLATTSSNGLLSSADKAKIDQISELSAKITALETAKTELESTISELETKVGQLEGYVNALLERVDLENKSF